MVHRQQTYKQKFLQHSNNQDEKEEKALYVKQHSKNNDVKARHTHFLHFSSLSFLLLGKGMGLLLDICEGRRKLITGL